MRVRFLAARQRVGFGDAVIGREPIQLTRPPPVDAAVAGPQHRAARSAHEQRDDRAAAAVGEDGPRRGAIQMVVHLLDALQGGVHQVIEIRGRRQVGQRVADLAAGDLAVAMPAESVGHHPQAQLRPLDEGVLVHRADAADVGRRRRSHLHRRADRAATPRADGSGRVTCAGTARQRCFAHVPSRNAPNVGGDGSPAPIRQLGSTIADPSVHHITSGW